jgi:outer membrane protein assembly factor BamE
MHRTLALALLTSATLLGGCVYRPDIQQGNLLRPEDIRQVTVGMTRSQVRYLLGTPMVSDPFAPQRWDYVYRMQYGRDKAIDSAHFVVYFEGDKVVRVEALDDPGPSHGAPGEDKKKKKKAPEQPAAPGGVQAPPAAPSTGQPQPPAPQPGAG